PFCALQCGMRLSPRTAAGPGQAPLDVVGDAAFPVNEGRMCIKGWGSVELLRSPERITAPMVRDARGVLRGATWDAALDELAECLSALRSAYGPESIGVFGSGALTNETAYLLGKFARVALRTPHIDYNGRYCMSSAAA